VASVGGHIMRTTKGQERVVTQSDSIAGVAVLEMLGRAASSGEKRGAVEVVRNDVKALLGGCGRCASWERRESLNIVLVV